MFYQQQLVFVESHVRLLIQILCFTATISIHKFKVACFLCLVWVFS